MDTGPETKRLRLDDDCVIHSTSELATAPLVELRDLDSWKTLLRAAQIHEHQPLLDIAESLKPNELPEVKYHAKCRKLFTMKKLLDSIQNKCSPTASKTCDKQSKRKSIRDPPANSPVYDPKCVVCDKVNKYLKGSKTWELLQKCVTMEADEALRNAAISKMESHVTAALSRDAVAAEVHFHRSCYRSYTKLDNPRTDVPAPSEMDYSTTETTAFVKICDYIQNDLIANPRAILFAELRNIMVSYMTDLGVTATESTKKNFRRKIETEFQDSIVIIPDDNNRLILYPYNLTVGKLVCDIIRIERELSILQSKKSDQITTLLKAALTLRTYILTHETCSQWPPSLGDISNSDDVIPTSLRHFLKFVLTGSQVESVPSLQTERHISSIGQDILYVVSHGKQQPPKDILLPLVVKSLTGNVELLQLLNRLGHSVSYSMTQQIETALCIQKMESVGESAIPLPHNIHPNVFTTLVWDNIDRIEETLTGGGTSHRVNGIAIQPKFIGPQLPKEKHITGEKSKRRSIDADPEPIPPYNAGNRAEPPPTIAVEPEHSKEFSDGKNKNAVWSFLREERDNVPSWTGFNTILQQTTEACSDEIGYLPTIHAPATDIAIVYEILQCSVMIQKQLQLPYIICVFDQAIYAKAIELTWKHPHLFKELVIRMGDFHTVFNFMATIGKRFQDAGLRDLAVESDVIAEGSSQAVMECRLYKLVYEALLRLAWKTFPRWLQTTYPEKQHVLTTLLTNVGTTDETAEESMAELLRSDSCQEVLNLFEVYTQHIRNGEGGDLAAFWMSYVDMVDIVLGLIRAAREGNWDLHLQSVRAMIPWLFAYDRVNYVRYLPYYYASRTRLDITHPGVSEEFRQGRFSVQIGTSNPFAKIPADQAIEETINRDTQTSGGTKGFSLKPAAVLSICRVSQHRPSWASQIYQPTQISSTSQRPPTYSNYKRQCRYEINNQHFGKWLGKSNGTRWWRFGLYIHRPPGTPRNMQGLVFRVWTWWKGIPQIQRRKDLNWWTYTEIPWQNTQNETENFLGYEQESERQVPRQRHCSPCR